MEALNVKQLLQGTRLYAMKPVHMLYDAWSAMITVGYVGMCGDLFHAGHLNILQIAKVHSRIVVAGVLTDEAVEAYKRRPVMPFDERARIVRGINCVDIVVPQHTLSYRDNLLALKPDLLFHGKDWREGVQTQTRAEAVETLAEYGGKLIEPDCYQGVSTTRMIERLYARSGKNRGDS